MKAQTTGLSPEDRELAVLAVLETLPMLSLLFLPLILTVRSSMIASGLFIIPPRRILSKSVMRPSDLGGWLALLRLRIRVF